MNKQIINKLLETIKYPGFSRDILSFGIVKDISIKDSQVDIELLINTENNRNIELIKEELNKKFHSLNSNYTLNIHLLSDNKSESSANIEKPLSNIKNIIAVASGKGGVGKSTVSINLASSLSKQFKVGILDLDIYGPSLPMMVGNYTQPELTSEQKLIPIKKYNMELMSFGFINNSNSATIWRGPMVARLTQQFFNDVVWGNLDYLIIDLPPGTGDIQLTLVQKLQLSGAIIVTTPQDLALLDAKKAADMFNKVNTKILGIVENMSIFCCPHCNAKTKILPGKGTLLESKRLEVPILGEIPINLELAKSSDRGSPYILKDPESDIAQIYKNISNQIINIIDKEEN